MASLPTPTDDNRDGIALSSASDTIPKDMLSEAPPIVTLRRRFDESRTMTDEARRKSGKRRDYFDGPKQLDSDVRRILVTRGQPAIYTNRVRPAVNGILGVLDQGRRDPRCLARNPDDEDAADVATKVLRYVNDQSKFNDTQIDVAEDFLIYDSGAVIVEMIDGEIVPTQIRWEELYYDPYSRRADFKDARYMGIAKWMDADQIKQKYRTRIDEIGDPMNASAIGVDTYDDRPVNMGWIDPRRRRVMLIEEYALEAGQWMRIVYIAAGVLEYDVSPYHDDKGRPCNPIEGVSCYIDRDNNRYSPVEDMIPIQDEVNASRSRSLHLMNSRQVQEGPQGGDPIDTDTVRAEAAKADGVIPRGWMVVPTGEMTNANMNRMLEAKAEIERMGPTPAVLGRLEGGDQSGRARLVSQQAGLTELARPLGRLHAWVLRCYVQMWNRARQFKTDPWWVRVTGDTQAPEFLKVNEPVMGPAMQPVADPATGQPMMDPTTGQPVKMPGIGQVGTKNRLAEMDMDIILDQDDDTASLQQEVWAELIQLVGSAGGLQAIFSDEFETAVEMSPLADKRRILEGLKAKKDAREQSQVTRLTQQVQQLSEQLQQKQEVTAAEIGSKIQLNEANALKSHATANQTMVETAKSEVGLNHNPLDIQPIAQSLPT